MKRAMEVNNWNPLLACDDPNEVYNTLEERIKTYLNQTCPVREFRIPSDKKVKLSKETLLLMRRRRFLLRKTRKVNTINYQRNRTAANNISKDILTLRADVHNGVGDGDPN